MTCKLVRILLILGLVFNPFEGVFAQAKMQTHAGSGQSVWCNNDMSHSELESTKLNKGLVLIDTADFSLYTVGLCKSQSPTTCGEKSCGECSNCLQGFDALNLTWAPVLQSIPSSLLVLYKAFIFNVDSQPDLHPPRIL